MGDKKFEFIVGKPCWELKYCPYGPIVEQYPLAHSEIDLDEIQNQYQEMISNFATGKYKTEDDILDATLRLEYLWPDRWSLVAEYDYSQLQYRTFGHICPVFFNGEPLTETKEVRPWPNSRHIPREVMLKVARRDGQMCQNCGKNVLDHEIEFDHIIPFSKGGPTTVDNLRVLCTDCNRKKRDTLDDMLRINWFDCGDSQE